MKSRYNYRIYPTPQQQVKLSQLFGCCRVVWNDALAIVKNNSKCRKFPTNASLQKQCITFAKQTPERQWLAEVSNIALQQSLNDLNTGFKNFFESRSGKRKGKKVNFPIFKKRTNNQSARLSRGGFSLKGNKVYLAKIGNLKTRWSRELPPNPSSVTITKNTVGQYHLSFVVETQQIDAKPINPSIGVDLGIKVFGFFSNGEKAVGPSYKKLDRKIRRFQRKLNRQIKGSKRREQTRLAIAKLNLKIRNIRKDFHHKLSTQLIRENQTVSLEDLNVAGMVKNRKLARAISQQGWGDFRRMCEAKAKQYKDRKVVIINRWEPTSQICSACGFKWGKLDLSIREIRCVSCHTLHDRDQNAAVNIEHSGLELAREYNWAKNEHQTRVSSNSTALPSRLLERQLCLF